MKNIIAIILIIVVTGGYALANEEITLTGQEAKLNYSVGYKLARDMKRQGIEIRSEAVLQGIADALADGETLLSAAERRVALIDLQQRINDNAAQEQQDVAQKNLTEGMAFFKENAQKEGVISLSSGLQYKILKEGHEDKPTIEDKVTVHYVGKLLDGTVFDSSIARGEPATFRVNAVIPGWQEALQRMGVGAKWRLFVPPGLAYGNRQVNEKIVPNSSLIFEVELLSIEKPAK